MRKKFEEEDGRELEREASETTFDEIALVLTVGILSPAKFWSAEEHRALF